MSTRSESRPASAAELGNAFGSPAGDLHHAVRLETARLLKQSDGDAALAIRTVVDRLALMGLVDSDETAVLQELSDISFAVAAGKKDPTAAYLTVRKAHAELASSGHASGTALAVASSVLGSFTLDPDPGGSGLAVTYARTTYGTQGAAIGAARGGLLGGPLGGVLGGEIGGLVGGVVDSCLDKK